MAWNVFDEMGNKVGEITEGTSDDSGLGCVALAFIGLVAVVGAVVIVPLLWKQIGILTIIPFILPIYLAAKGMRFSELYGCALIISCVFLPIMSWIVDGKFNLDVATFFSIVFLSALLAIPVTIVSLIIGKLWRFIKAMLT